MRILIADDDLTCRVILRKSLEKLGHEVIVSADGDEAWTQFKETNPEVVISDWMMPGKDGLALCDAIRSEKNASYTYFILLTALNDKDSVLRGLEAGADDYLTKPFDSKELQARLISGRRVTELHRELARLNEKLYKEGRTDPLTRVGNRRCMQEELDQLFDRAQRYEQGFSVALCDIDHFKTYNDHFGHLQGDVALKAVAEVLRNQGRCGDSVYRYGGEEFLIVLPGQTLDKAALAMERRREAVMAAKISHPMSDTAEVVTISVGIAAYFVDDDANVIELVKRADRALYEAKSSGRNCIKTHPPGSN
jgi:diguanylate cyclase (GGDEF)-like protein